MSQSSPASARISCKFFFSFFLVFFLWGGLQIEPAAPHRPACLSPLLLKSWLGPICIYQGRERERERERERVLFTSLLKKDVTKPPTKTPYCTVAGTILLPRSRLVSTSPSLFFTRGASAYLLVIILKKSLHNNSNCTQVNALC